MKKATLICLALFLVVLLLLLSGCATSLKSLEGVYTTELTIAILDTCGGFRGYHQATGKKSNFICLASENEATWEELWAHETDHLFRNLVGLPQPLGHKARFDSLTGRLVRVNENGDTTLGRSVR